MDASPPGTHTSSHCKQFHQLQLPLAEKTMVVDFSKVPRKPSKRKQILAPHGAKLEHMAVRKTTLETIPPTLSPFQSVRYLQRQIERLEQQIISLPANHPDVEGWMSTTIDILNQTFGQPNGEMHPKTSDFVYAAWGLQCRKLPTGSHVNTVDAQRLYVVTQQKRKALLNAYVRQLKDLAPTSAATALDLYVFHPEIEIVSSRLYRDGHYKQAALAANLRVIEEVKKVSGISDDGESHINKAFNFDVDRQIPMIQFNSLGTEAQREEQLSMLYLFKGILGLCNSKADCDHLFNDPLLAHEYLALASLLMRMLEIAQLRNVPLENS